MEPIIIKNRNVRLSDKKVACGGDREVELLKNGDVVHAIRFQCACGESTVVRLEYGTDKQVKS